MTKTPEWKQFEIAVANFLQSLDKNAKITHDINIPDKDTGEPRQRDVWIEATLCKMFPIKIYVSCKFINKKIDTQDMDAVIGELRSSGANKGAIYSKSGFTKGAIKKAKATDISCCKLYDNQPPDLPEMLIFKSYLANTSIIFDVLNIENDNSIKIYNDLFVLRDKDTNKLLIDKIQETYFELEKMAIKKKNKKEELPQDWQSLFDIITVDNKKIKIRIAVKWKFFEAISKAHFISGSYSFSNGFFAGTQTTPVIDLKSFHPGKGWQALKERPRITGNHICMFLTKGDCKQALINNLGNKEIILRKLISL